MVIVKYFIECDFYSKEKLLKYYDLVIGHAFPLVDYYKNYEVKSKNSKITIALMRMVKIVETISDLTQLSVMKDMKIE